MEIKVINKSNQLILSEKKTIREYFEDKIKQNILKEDYLNSCFKLNIEKINGLYNIEMIFIPTKNKIIKFDVRHKDKIEKGINISLKKLAHELSANKKNKKVLIGPRALNKIEFNSCPEECYE